MANFTSSSRINVYINDKKEDILGFVEAGNQINVALGEDLGADAIKIFKIQHKKFGSVKIIFVPLHNF